MEFSSVNIETLVRSTQNLDVIHLSMENCIKNTGLICQKKRTTLLKKKKELFKKLSKKVGSKKISVQQMKNNFIWPGRFSQSMVLP